MASALGVNPALRAAVYAQGSDAPEKKEVKIGLIPLTDCASIVMTSVLGFDKKHGVTTVPSKDASWASIRDKVVTGENDITHMLLGQTYGVHMGAGGTKKIHGRVDDAQPQRPGYYPEQKVGRKRRGGRPFAGQIDDH